MNKKLKILLIEDDLIEVMKIERAMVQLSLDHQLTIVKNGDEAIKILQNENLELPDLILVDLYMSIMGGLEFLAILKSDSYLKVIPAIVLTASINKRNIEESYKMGIAGYIIKSLRYEEYVIKLKIILEYWCLNTLFKK
jgi:CheY-like chemotaxis protein